MISQEHKRQQKKNQYDLKADRTSHGSAERHNKDDAQKATTQHTQHCSIFTRPTASKYRI